MSALRRRGGGVVKGRPRLPHGLALTSRPPPRPARASGPAGAAFEGRRVRFTARPDPPFPAVRNSLCASLKRSGGQEEGGPIAMETGAALGAAIGDPEPGRVDAPRCLGLRAAALKRSGLVLLQVAGFFWLWFLWKSHLLRKPQQATVAPGCPIGPP